MPWEIIIHSEVSIWTEKLNKKMYENLNAVILALRDEGPALGRPIVDHIKGSRLSNLKEMRVPGSHIRVLFAFNNDRVALLLVGGDKSNNWKRWYEENIPIAELRFQELNLLLRKGQ